MKTFLTALVALYLVAVLTCMVGLCFVAPLWTVVLIPAMAVNGKMATEWVATIWGLDVEAA